MDEILNILEANGYAPSEKNAAIFVENYNKGVQEYVDMVNGYALMEASELLCEDDDVADEIIDAHSEEYAAILAEAFDVLNNNEEVLTEGIGYAIGRAIGKAKGAVDDVKNTAENQVMGARRAMARQAQYAQERRRARANIANSKDAINVARDKAHTDIKQAKIIARDKWKNLSASERAARDSKLNAGKATWKQDKETYKNDKNKAKEQFDLGNISKDQYKQQIKKAKDARKAAKNTYKDVLLHNTEKGFMNQGKALAKENTKKVIDTEKEKIRNAKQAPTTYAYTPKNNSKAEQDKQQAANAAAKNLSNAITESYSLYELCQILENNGYEPSDENLNILTEGLENGDYSIEFDAE